MNHNVYIYILVMATVTYFIRMIPLVLLRKNIENTFLRSFLYYVPYVTLSVMTFPAILSATGNFWSALAGFAVALLLAFRGKSLPLVALVACVVVYLAELLLIPSL